MQYTQNHDVVHINMWCHGKHFNTILKKRITLFTRCLNVSFIHVQANDKHPKKDTGNWNKIISTICLNKVYIEKQKLKV